MHFYIQTTTIFRLDRDDHITVYFENIQDGLDRQFEKKEDAIDAARNTPYDYLSIMHYGKSSFAKRDSAVSVKARMSVCVCVCVCVCACVCVCVCVCARACV